MHDVCRISKFLFSIILTKETLKYIHTFQRHPDTSNVYDSWQNNHCILRILKKQKHQMPHERQTSLLNLLQIVYGIFQVVKINRRRANLTYMFKFSQVISYKFNKCFVLSQTKNLPTLILKNLWKFCVSCRFR